MPSTKGTLTQGSPDSAVITLDIDAPIIAINSGMKKFDKVKLLYSMNDNPESGQKAHIFDGNKSQEFPSLKSGDKIQFLGNWFDANARSVEYEYRTA